MRIERKKSSDTLAGPRWRDPAIVGFFLGGGLGLAEGRRSVLVQRRVWAVENIGVSPFTVMLPCREYDELR